MFDDPQKELKRLEELLLQSEDKDDDFERFYQDILDEYGPTEQPQAAPAAPVKKKTTYADIPRAVAPKKKKSLKGVLIVICAELVGIAAIVGYWLMRLS